MYDQKNIIEISEATENVILPEVRSFDLARQRFQSFAILTCLLGASLFGTKAEAKGEWGSSPTASPPTVGERQATPDRITTGVVGFGLLQKVFLIDELTRTAYFLIPADPSSSLVKLTGFSARVEDVRSNGESDLAHGVVLISADNVEIIASHGKQRKSHSFGPLALTVLPFAYSSSVQNSARWERETNLLQTLTSSANRWAAFPVALLQKIKKPSRGFIQNEEKEFRKEATSSPQQGLQAEIEKFVVNRFLRLSDGYYYTAAYISPTGMPSIEPTASGDYQIYRFASIDYPIQADARSVSVSFKGELSGIFSAKTNSWTYEGSRPVKGNIIFIIGNGAHATLVSVGWSNGLKSTLLSDCERPGKGLEELLNIRSRSPRER